MMRHILAVAAVAALAACNQPAQSAVPEVAPEISAWVDACSAAPNDCLGDIYYLNGQPRRADFANSLRADLDTLKAANSLDSITRVVELGPTPEYAQASQEFYGVTTAPATP